MISNTFNIIITTGKKVRCPKEKLNEEIAKSPG